MTYNNAFNSDVSYFSSSYFYEESYAKTKPIRHTPYPGRTTNTGDEGIKLYVTVLQSRPCQDHPVCFAGNAKRSNWITT
jgi:hypothetical protein